MPEPMGAADPDDEGGMGRQLQENSAVLPTEPVKRSGELTAMLDEKGVAYDKSQLLA